MIAPEVKYRDFCASRHGIAATRRSEVARKRRAPCVRCAASAEEPQSLKGRAKLAEAQLGANIAARNRYTLLLGQRKAEAQGLPPQATAEYSINALNCQIGGGGALCGSKARAAFCIQSFNDFVIIRTISQAIAKPPARL